jgi:hypothetical protein
MFWILVGYGIACTIAFVVGVGPTPGNPRKWYWWERVLTFPIWLLSEIAQKVPFVTLPVMLWIQFYTWCCMPLAYLYESYEMWRYNRKNNG